jgi:hypothetical protein
MYNMKLTRYKSIIIIIIIIIVIAIMRKSVRQNKRYSCPMLTKHHTMKTYGEV